jgi:hypothetical protein
LATGKFRLNEARRTKREVMYEFNHAEIVRREEQGEILIGIEPAVARKFFTDTKHQEIQQEIGEPLYIERFFVRLFFYLSGLSLLAGIVVSVLVIKWYSVVAIPLMLIGWFILSGKASMGKQKLGYPFVLVILSLILVYFLRSKGIAISIWIVLIPLPYFFSQLTYKTATVFLRALSIRNEKAFNLLFQTGIFLKEVG